MKRKISHEITKRYLTMTISIFLIVILTIIFSIENYFEKEIYRTLDYSQENFINNLNLENQEIEQVPRFMFNNKYASREVINIIYQDEIKIPLVNKEIFKNVEEKINLLKLWKKKKILNTSKKLPNLEGATRKRM